MEFTWRLSQRGAGLFLFALSLVVVAGCGKAPRARFQLNTVYVEALSKQGELTAAQQRNIADILVATFGTPDEPRLPQLAGTDIGAVVSIDKLRTAAGPVGSDELGRERGLYRQHCVHCHGVTGDGAGPTAAFLNPYPRDYRRGTFKFKSTKGEEPPTHADLKRILVNGIPGTAMPSFNVLDDGELDALIHYVKYLSLRGRTERALIEAAVDELKEDELYLDVEKSSSAEFHARMKYLNDTVSVIAGQWEGVQSVKVPKPPADWETPESITQGRKMFFTLGNCAQCHGVTALGDGRTDNYDKWTEDWHGTGPTKIDDDRVRDFMRLGALKPRTILPRNLRQGVYRGGRRPIDLYWRIKNSIGGTPMPAASDTMSDDDLWHLIAYVRSLPLDSLSQPRHVADFQRDLP